MQNEGDAEDPRDGTEEWSEGPVREPLRPRPETDAARARSHVPRHSRHATKNAGRDRQPSPKPPRLPRTKPVKASRPPSPSAAAESLAPRAAAPVGIPPRAARGALATAALIATLVIVAVVAWWLFTRPAALALTPSPTDSAITIAGHGTRTGTVTLDELEPGMLTATVARSGFVTTTVTIEVSRGIRTVRAVTLRPLPCRMDFTTRPSGATVQVTDARGAVLTGLTPCSLVTSAGPITVVISRSGSNTFTQRLFLDAARTFDVLLDPKGQVVHALGSLAAKGAPKGVAVTPDGREAWASILNGPPSIEIYDLKTMAKTGGIDIGKYGSVEIIFNADGTRAYASQMETAKVFEIDTATRKVTRSFATGSAWTKVVALSPDEKTLYAANWSGNDVSLIDLTTGKLLRRIPTAKTPRGLWPTKDGLYLYVAGFDKGELQRIDLKSGVVKTLFKSGGALRHLVADENTGKLYASDMSKDVVWVLDMNTLKTKKFCDTDEKPNTIELSPDGMVLFISNRGENNPKSYYLKGYEWGTILLMSTDTGAPLDAIVGGNQCTALDVSADGHTLVFSDFLDDRLRVYDIPGYATLLNGAEGRFATHFADLKKSRP